MSHALVCLIGLQVVAALALPIGVAGQVSRAGATGTVDAAHATQDEPRGMGDRGGLGIELGLGVLGEAWNLNDNGREWLADGNVAIWWTFRRHATLVVDFHATRVFQQRIRNAFVNGVAPTLRWHVAERGAWRTFVEIGSGLSWSDTAVPKRGTRFNYLVHAGAGVSRRVGRATDVIAGFRWLHLSNNGREGNANNPDIEALGGYAAMAIAF